MRKILNMKYMRFVLLITAGVLIGWLIKPSPHISVTASTNSHTDLVKNQIWTCSMHPQIRRNEPGQCPICGMDLIPLNTQDSDDNPMGVSMTANAMELANVETMIIGNQKPIKEVRMTGKVQADERMIFSQVSHIPGRIEQLLINFTGEEVKKGQILALIYSPELIIAQEELFEAIKIKVQQPILYDAAKEKLKNWKLTDKQIDQIITNGNPQENFSVLADASGVVLKRRVNTGDYVMKGMPIYDVVDLSKIWVLFDIYESDMAWVKVGSKVDFTIPSIPGENFTGSISFIDPVINPQTRVAKARVEFANNNKELKPEMFASGLIKSELTNKNEGIVIPKSAVMWTGERSVVYIKSTTEKGVNFQMQQVTLGPSLGDSYIIKAGLETGTEIAVNGTFSIDAAAQLAGKPSMMNPEGGPVMTGHNHGGMSMPNNTNSTATAHSKTISVSKKVKEILSPLFNEYLLLKDALVANKFDKSKQISTTLLSDLNGVSMSNFTGEAHGIWMQHSSEIEKTLKTINKEENIGGVRREFKTLSDQFIMLAKTFGPFEEPLYIQHCPMANKNKGADWISKEKEIKNPYLGEAMLTCGEVKQKLN